MAARHARLVHYDDAGMVTIAPPLPRDAPVHKRLVRIVIRIVQGLRIHNADGAAPAMAFHFFLSLVPVLVLIGFVLGQVVRQRGVDALLGPAIFATPGAAEQIIRAELERLAGADGASIAPLSVLGFWWLAAAGTHGLMDELEVIAAAPRRAWWRKRLLAHAWVAGALAVMAVVAWSVVAIDAAFRSRSPAPGVAVLREAWERISLAIALALVTLTGLAVFFRVAVAHPPGVRRRVWPGALLAFAAWVIVSWGFGIYVSSLGRYALFYGSVAAVAVLLMWFYLTSWSLLIGAELNAQLEGHRDRP